MRFLLCLSSILVIGLASSSFIWFDATKPWADKFGNHASLLGLIVSIIGFALTVWAMLETQKAVAAARRETSEVLKKVRIKAFADTCEQAYFFANESRNAIRTETWHRAAERGQDARQSALRLLVFKELTEAERTGLRAVVEDLQSMISFIERNRLKPGAPKGLPNDKIGPLDQLLDELQGLRSRLSQEVLEVPDVN